MSAERRKRGNGRRLSKVVFYSALSAQFSALLPLAGCAIPQVPSRIVYEDPVNFVRLEIDSAVLPEWPPSAHSHPTSLREEEMMRLLRGMFVQEHRIGIQRWFQGEAPVVPVFEKEEVELLAVRLTEALSQAKGNERVTYYLSKPQTSAKRIITSGGFYLRGSEFHFLLGNWQVVYGIPAYGMIYDRRYPMNPISPKGFDLFFDVKDAVIKQETGFWDKLLANEKDELVVDLQTIFPGPVVSLPSPSSDGGFDGRLR